MVFCFVVDSSCFMDDFADASLTAMDVCKCVIEHLLILIKQKVGSLQNYDKSYMLLETGMLLENIWYHHFYFQLH